MDPCGTPNNMHKYSVNAEPNLTLCFLSVRYEKRSLRLFKEKPYMLPILL